MPVLVLYERFLPVAEVKFRLSITELSPDPGKDYLKHCGDPLRFRMAQRMLLESPATMPIILCNFSLCKIRNWKQ